MPGDHGLLEPQLLTQGPLRGHHVLVKQPAREETRAQDQRHQHLHRDPPIRRASPGEREDHEAKPKKEQQLAANVKSHKTAPNRRLGTRHHGIVNPVQRLGPDQLLPQDEEDDDDAQDADRQVDAETPPPVRSRQIASDDGADRV